MRQFSVEWNRDYGIDKRRGWTLVVNGRVIAQLTWLVALPFAWLHDWWLYSTPRPVPPAPPSPPSPAESVE